jgi:hypothetical protein
MDPDDIMGDIIIVALVVVVIVGCYVLNGRTNTIVSLGGFVMTGE